MYGKHYSTRCTPQTEPIPGRNMVQNNAKGYAFPVDDWTRLDRFLILGSEGGTYYVREKDLTVRNADAVRRCVQADGPRAVGRIREISIGGRAPDNDPALFALALACKFGNQETRALAFRALSDVARIGTHLFHFARYAKGAFGLSGRGWRTAVSEWYNGKEPRKLAYQLAKYQQRDGWSHADLLKLARPKPRTPEHDALYAYAVHGTIPNNEYVQAVEEAKVADNEKRIIDLVLTHGLTREMIPTKWLNSAKVWDALLARMPMGAMVRNLGKMSNVGLIKPLSKTVSLVADRLRDGERIAKSRLHPLSVLIAMRTYQNGQGFRGSLRWDPVAQVVDALDDAFYLAFGNVGGTDKATMLALDVSGSMGTALGQYPISCREASAAMAMVTARTETRHMFTAFTSDRGYSRAGISELDISSRQRLDDIVHRISDLPFGGTDCALPMLHAAAQGYEIDAFVVYTDSETWAGNVHPVQALDEYRRKMGIPAKLIVVGMVSNGFSIADPDDGGMLDVVGFDTATPQLIEGFVKG